MIKVVNPSVELWKQDGYSLSAIWKHIARCARVCYQSTPKDSLRSLSEYKGIYPFLRLYQLFWACCISAVASPVIYKSQDF